MRRQRWPDEEVVERLIESMKAWWKTITKKLEKEDGWIGTWDSFIANIRWRNWGEDTIKYYFFIEQGQQILDIKDDELDALLKEAIE